MSTNRTPVASMLRSELWRSTFRTFSMLPKRGAAIVTTAGVMAARRSMFGPIAVHFVCNPSIALLPLTGRAYLYRWLHLLLLVTAIRGLKMRPHIRRSSRAHPRNCHPSHGRQPRPVPVRTRGERRGAVDLAEGAGSSVELVCQSATTAAAGWSDRAATRPAAPRRRRSVFMTPTSPRPNRSCRRTYS